MLRLIIDSAKSDQFAIGLHETIALAWSWTSAVAMSVVLYTLLALVGVILFLVRNDVVGFLEARLLQQVTSNVATLERDGLVMGLYTLASFAVVVVGFMAVAIRIPTFLTQYILFKMKAPQNIWTSVASALIFFATPLILVEGSNILAARYVSPMASTIWAYLTWFALFAIFIRNGFDVVVNYRPTLGGLERSPASVSD